LRVGPRAVLKIVSALLGIPREVDNPLDTVRGLGAAARTVRSTFQDRYRIDLDALQRRLSPRTSVVMLASPQNPSGLGVPAADISAILA
jgi:aspartate/methionine/tyrosine aminotransferase